MLYKEIFLFLFLAFVLLCIDFYAFQAFKTVYPLNTHTGKVVATVYWSFTIYMIIISFFVAFFGVDHLPADLRRLTGTIFFFTIFAKFFAIFWLFGEDLIRVFNFFIDKLKGNPNPHIASRRKFISHIATVSSLVPIAVLTYGMVRNAYNYKYIKQQLNFNKLPKAFKGYRIVQLSDIHAGSFNRKKPIEKAVKKINKLKPDLILFTGDLVNDFASEMDEYTPIFKKLKAKDGVYSSLGNHDYGDYAYGMHETPEKIENFKKFLEVHKNLGWTLLRDEHVRIKRNEDFISLIAVENWSSDKRFPSRGNLTKAYQDVNESDFKILMSHDPSHWDAEIRPKFPNIDLTLSGHTHGFQFGIENKYIKWSPCKYFFKQWAGLYKEGKQYLYVNRGFGNLGYQGRIGIMPEVTIIDLN